MKIKIKIIILVTLVTIVGVGFLAANFETFALTLGGETQEALNKQDTAFISASGLGKERPAAVVADVVKIVLGFLGVIFIVLIIYSGLAWMTSAGNEEKISKAKKIMAGAVIGLAIVLAAYMITYFVIDKLLEATGASRTGLD